ncbi:MBL fold metallo-hydrolase [Streptomyces sp. SDT5-1]|uniref:MBL fold metallo-hydrolase n=1 Tax=Streptomyces sp. SDT5-1 TaxID=3406418 RepID=UPI003FD4BE4F
MCTDEPPGRSPTRRTLLRTAAALATTATVGTVVAPVAVAEPLDSGTHLFLLGTAGGPPPFADRAGISSALVVGGRTYVVDCGRGAVTQYLKAGLDMRSLSGIFLTHLHADHTVDYFSFPLLSGGVAEPFAGFSDPIDVYGPPRTAELTHYADRAWAASTEAFAAEGLGTPPTDLLHVHETTAPDSVGADIKHTAPTMSPFLVMESDDMKVTAVLVPHGAAFPAYAYRFDTDGGSVVFSGDTALTPNIPTLARGADVLVHEVIDTSWFEDQGFPDAVVTHMHAVHTPIAEIGRIGAEADAGKVVLTHFSPGDPHARTDSWWRRAAAESRRAARYTGDIVVGHDLMHVPVGVTRGTARG